MNDDMRAVGAAMADEFDGQGDVVAVAPGRVNLLGGHTDYNEGYVLPVTIDRRVVAVGRKRSDRTIAVRSRDYDERRSFSLDDVQRDGEVTWIDYVKGVAAQFRSDGLPGVDLAVGGDVPRGAGLASSAAFELAIGAALSVLSDRSFSPRELALRCWRAENEFVGVECGIMDQFASALGRAESALFLDCRSRSFERIPFDAGTIRVVVIDTNVTHELADSAYNRRRAECREAAARFDELLNREVTTLRDVSPTEFETHADDVSPTLRDRCEHVVFENERVTTAAAALERGDVERVGELMFESHASLRDRYEVSCPELDAVVEATRGHDAVVGSRMTGAGFGGCVVSLVRDEGVDALTAHVEREFADRFDAEPDAYVCDTADGCRVHRE
ncbi:galactokinase [Halegenticoccus tardaugens]|uniref:galactokinase n=1 Tax=Halegenticoccus tardaugens TaxID=2071624 RepID=UPI00100BC4BB|nr:galactokinase [Halegenticoccus tardaugens]